MKKNIIPILLTAVVTFVVAGFIDRMDIDWNAGYWTGRQFVDEQERQQFIESLEKSNQGCVDAQQRVAELEKQCPNL